MARPGFVVLVAAVAGGCAGGDHNGNVSATATAAETSAPAWTEAKATRSAAGSTVTVDGRCVTVDRTTLVCWGAGVPKRRGTTRRWARFDCIAPTFRGAEAGPDLLFVLKPTGPTRFRVRNARFSSYGGG